MRSTILDDLTERQREIALLVADGYRNSEIAVRLHMSQPNVVRHIGNVYVALGIDTRGGSSSARVHLARKVWEAQVNDLVDELLAERSTV